MTRDVLVYLGVLLPVCWSARLVFRKYEIGLPDAVSYFFIILIFGSAGSFLGLPIRDTLVSLALMVLFEELGRAIVLNRLNSELSILKKSIAVGILFSILETNNWIFIDKARVVFKEMELDEYLLIIADVVYIKSEFLSGMVFHSLLTVLMAFLMLKLKNYAPNLVSILFTFSVHFSFNYVVLMG